jgi:hypothetical protein
LENPRVLTPFPHADLNVKLNGDWGSVLPVFPKKQDRIFYTIKPEKYLSDFLSALELQEI